MAADEPVYLAWPSRLALGDILFPYPGVGLMILREATVEEISRGGCAPPPFPFFYVVCPFCAAASNPNDRVN